MDERHEAGWKAAEDEDDREHESGTEERVEMKNTEIRTEGNIGGDS